MTDEKWLILEIHDADYGCEGPCPCAVPMDELLLKNAFGETCWKLIPERVLIEQNWHEGDEIDLSVIEQTDNPCET